MLRLTEEELKTLAKRKCQELDPRGYSNHGFAVDVVCAVAGELQRELEVRVKDALKAVPDWYCSPCNYVFYRLEGISLTCPICRNHTLKPSSPSERLMASKIEEAIAKLRDL